MTAANYKSELVNEFGGGVLLSHFTLDHLQCHSVVGGLARGRLIIAHVFSCLKMILLECSDDGLLNLKESVKKLSLHELS